MASSSDQRSDSSDRSKSRRRVVIGPQDTSRVRYENVKAASSRTSQRGQRSPEKKSRRPVPGDLANPGRRVAANRAEERDRRLQVGRRRKRLRVGGVVLLVAALVAGAIALYRSDLFAVEQIDVAGATRLTQEQVRALAAIQPDATLLRLPAREIEQRLERNAWVASAEVSRDYPDTVRIRVVERTPAALVDAGGSTLWEIDSSGVWLAPRSADATSSLVLIRDVPGLDPVAGRRTGSEALQNALEIAQRLDPYMRSVVRTVVAPAIDKTALITTDDVEVFVGSSEDIARKQEVARKILAQQAGKVVYINVRSVDRPTWRGLDSK